MGSVMHWKFMHTVQVIFLLPVFLLNAFAAQADPENFSYLTDKQAAAELPATKNGRHATITRAIGPRHGMGSNSSSVSGSVDFLRMVWMR